MVSPWLMLEILFGWQTIIPVVTFIVGGGLWGFMSMSPPEYEWAKICIFVGIFLLVAKTGVWLIFDSDLVGSNRVVLAIIVFGLSGTFWVESWRWIESRQPKIPGVKERLKLFARTSDADYPKGATIGGILWSPRFAELRISIVNSINADYHDVDIVLRPDEPIAAIAQTTNVPNVVLSTARDIDVYPEFFEGATGQRRAIPLVLIASTSGYRIRCPVLHRKSRIEIILATAQVEDAPKSPQPPLGTYNREGVLRIDYSDGTSLWFGHGTDANGRIDDVYKSQRPTPKVVQVEGRYMIYGKEETIAEQLVVHDRLGESLPKIKEQINKSR